MAPIPRFAAKPFSIITGALFAAFSTPPSSPPSNGTDATVWGTAYTGTASYLNFNALNTSSPAPSSSPSSSTPTSSLVFYDAKVNSYSGCDKKAFSATDKVVLMNPLQFGQLKSQNSTCSQWVEIKNRENTLQSTLARVVGVCDHCEYGSLEVSLSALKDLSPELPWTDMTFDASAKTTLFQLMDPSNPLPLKDTPVSSRQLLNIVWSLSKPPQVPAGSPSAAPTPTSTSAPPNPTGMPSQDQHAGRATWFSDTHGQCSHDYSQSDDIVALAEEIMGSGTSFCGRKIRVTMKGSTTEVIATVVDMCPREYCQVNDLDLSQAAFKKLAPMSVGELDVQWTFV